jgi:outer membrane protease
MAGRSPQRWFWLLVPMVAGCGLTVYDKGSDVYSAGGMNLVYTDWVAPKDRDWQKDAYECDTEAREAVPTLVRVPGQRQALAERCLNARGYTKRPQ